MSFGSPNDRPETTPKKPKKIHVGDEFYVPPGMGENLGLKSGTGATLVVKEKINLKRIAVEVIRAGEGEVSGAIVVQSDKLKKFPRERRGVSTMYDLDDKRVDELTDPDSQQCGPLRESDKPEAVRGLIIEAFHVKLARAGLQLMEE